MFDNGYWTAFRLRGVPIQLHWSVPVFAVFLSRLRFAPGIWLGFFLLVLVHEMGHAILVWRARLGMESIRIHGLGGECRYSGAVRPLDVSIIAWGGVLAQALLFGATYALVHSGLVPPQPHLAAMLEVWLEPNLVLIALNLLPFSAFDGAEAWKIFGRLRGKKKKTKVQSAPPPVEAGTEPLVVDPQRVGDSVREMLDQARREARDRRERQS